MRPKPDGWAVAFCTLFVLGTLMVIGALIVVGPLVERINTAIESVIP